jgi:branched-chain amino acid transport system ATP-binding protein
MAILLVEQDVMIAFELASRAGVLDSGRVVLTGRPRDLAQDPGDREADMGLA